MSHVTSSSTAGDIKEQVLAELAWEPSVDATRVGVIAEGGVVTLTGTVGSWAESQRIEVAARRVRGVGGVANVLAVRPLPRAEMGDGAIARAAWDAIHAHVFLPSNAVRIAVERARVTLRGELEWHFQKAAAEEAVRNLAGVVHVANEITLVPRRSPAGAGCAIAAALARHAGIDAERVRVDAAGDRVFLRGAVASLDQKQAAEDVAWSAPGIAHVVNELAVDARPWSALPDLVCLP
jgi:osmotically-inducible protein OsmY